MSITAFTGPVVQCSENPGGVPASDLNPEQGPSMWERGWSALDPRLPFTYQMGQAFGSKTYGWWGTSMLPCLDQVPSAINAANIAGSQSPGAGAITLVSSSGSGITVGVSITNAATNQTVTGLLAIDGAMGSTAFGQAATVQMWDATKAIARNIRITSGGDDHLLNFTVSGYDIYGYPMTELIAGTNGGIASGKKAFKYIASVTHTGSVASTVSVGTGDVYGLPLRADRLPYILPWWGTPQTLIATAIVANEETISFAITNSALANGQNYSQVVPFDFTIKSISYVVNTPVTTGGKAATLTAQVNGSNVGTGGVVSLTSAGMTPTNTIIAGTAISGTGTTGTAGQTVGFAVSSVTAFTEGTGYVEITVVNTDVGNAVFTAADTTSPATNQTGDVRGTLAPPTASDGTKRLTIYVTPTANNAAVSISQCLFGQTQA